MTPRQEEILTTSIRILTREGSRAITMKRVATELGLTEAAIYRHFPSKKALLVGLYGFVKDTLLARIAPIIASEASHEERLKSLLSATLRYLSVNRGVTLILLAESIFQHDDAINEAMRKLFTEFAAIAETLIQAGIAEGAFDAGLDARLASTALAGMVQGLLTRSLLTGDPIDPDALAPALAGMFLSGISKQRTG